MKYTQNTMCVSQHIKNMSEIHTEYCDANSSLLLAKMVCLVMFHDPHCYIKYKNIMCVFQHNIIKNMSEIHTEY